MITARRLLAGATATLLVAISPHSPLHAAAGPTQDAEEPADDEQLADLLPPLPELDDDEQAALADLAQDPYDLEAYRSLYDHAVDAGDPQEQLRWGKWLYWADHYAGRKTKSESMALELADLYAGWNADAEIVATWEASVQKAIRSAMSAKQYLVAGHLLGKLIDRSPGDSDLARQYDKLFDKAGTSLSGGAFTAARVRRRSARWVADQNEKHREWDKAFNRKTKYYDIVTNVSYEFFETVSVVMDEMFEFYREVYGHRGRAPKVTLAIHRKRSDFDKYCLDTLGYSLPLGVGGWFVPAKMLVAAYDRTESGEDLSGLYRTLFHESSHQFMELLTEKTRQEPPTWLNEGTASYFEGCELKADGSIVKNKPALGRVREWELFERDPRWRHTLEELVTCAHRDYGVDYYSYGWSLVYFLNNYESAAGELVYRDAYLKYLDSYTRKGPKDPSERQREAFARAEQMFVHEVADPDVPDWAAFEQRWRTYTQALVAQTRAGPELADELQARSRRYLESGDDMRALIAAEQADDKRPGDAETYRLLALSCAALRRDAEAVYWMLRHWETTWEDGDPRAVAAAEAWLARNDGDELVEYYCSATAQTLDSLHRAMDAAVSDDQPVAAMLHVTHVLTALGLEQRAVLDRVAAIRAESGRDLRLWLRTFTRDEKANRQWEGADLIRYDPDGVLINNQSEDSYPLVPCDAPTLAWLEPPYDVRGKVQVDGESPAHLYIGVPGGGQPRSGVAFGGKSGIAFEAVDRGYDPDNPRRRITTHEPVAKLDVGKTDVFPFFIEVGTMGGAAYFDGKKKVDLPPDWSADRLAGRLAVTCGPETIALFSDVEARSDRPFWPVERPDSP